jgi:hypothetical protein
MYIYQPIDPVKGVIKSHVITICPAAHWAGKACPSSWYDMSGEKAKPKEFLVEFVHGRAETDDELGNYFVESGLALRDQPRMVLPPGWH